MKNQILESQMESSQIRSRSRFQFGIRDLFGVTTFAAIGLALGSIDRYEYPYLNETERIGRQIIMYGIAPLITTGAYLFYKFSDKN